MSNWWGCVFTGRGLGRDAAAVWGGGGAVFNGCFPGEKPEGVATLLCHHPPRIDFPLVFYC